MMVNIVIGEEEDTLDNISLVISVEDQSSVSIPVIILLSIQCEVQPSPDQL